MKVKGEKSKCAKCDKITHSYADAKRHHSSNPKSHTCWRVTMTVEFEVQAPTRREAKLRLIEAMAPKVNSLGYPMQTWTWGECRTLPWLLDISASRIKEAK